MASKLLYYSHVNKSRSFFSQDPLRYYRYRRRVGRERTDRLLGGQRLRVFRYLVVEVLDRLAALRRLRLHRRLRIAFVDRQLGIVLRFHIDYANAERGAAVSVAGRVSCLVDCHHMTINDLQSNHLRESEISV